VPRNPGGAARYTLPALAGSSNGRTPDSGSGSLGSNPSPAAFLKPASQAGFRVLRVSQLATWIAARAHRDLRVFPMRRECSTINASPPGRIGGVATSPVPHPSDATSPGQRGTTAVPDASSGRRPSWWSRRGQATSIISQHAELWTRQTSTSEDCSGAPRCGISVLVPESRRSRRSRRDYGEDSRAREEVRRPGRRASGPPLPERARTCPASRDSGWIRYPFAPKAHSSSGLGRRPLTAVARVRIPYAPLNPC
jgi:hypothetical protein